MHHLNHKYIHLTIISIVFICSVIFAFLPGVKTKYFKLQNTTPVDNIYNHMMHRQDVVRQSDASSFHRWIEDLHPYVRSQINAIHQEIVHRINRNYIVVPSMTELYWSSKQNSNSDKQYVDTHHDGPFRHCRLHRILICINGNRSIRTAFPDEALDINLKTYEAVLFDYNKAPHYIYVDDTENDNSQRILLKLHYVIPPLQSYCKKINCKFARQTRDLFERNKQNLFIDGIISRASLYYFTFKKIILFCIF